MEAALKAVVRNGRIVMDEPTELPEGAVLHMVAVDAFDDMEDDERSRLHESLDAALAEPEEAGIEPAELLARLRGRG